MTKVAVHTVFSDSPVEVDPDEATALERSGLLRAGPVPAPAPVVRVMVTPRCTGVPIEVDPDEAVAMERGGLLVASDAETGEVTPPGELLPEIPNEQPGTTPPKPKPAKKET